MMSKLWLLLSVAMLIIASHRGYTCKSNDINDDGKLVVATSRPDFEELYWAGVHGFFPNPWNYPYYSQQNNHVPGIHTFSHFVADYLSCLASFSIFILLVFVRIRWTVRRSHPFQNIQFEPV